MGITDLFRRKNGIPEVSSHMGVAHVLETDDVIRRVAIGPSVSFSDIPDFDKTAEDQIQRLENLRTLHPKAAGFFVPEIVDECIGYCHRLRGEYERYSEQLQVTYRNSLLDGREKIVARLAAISADDWGNSR